MPDDKKPPVKINNPPPLRETDATRTHHPALPQKPPQGPTPPPPPGPAKKSNDN
jgi:hypothetical protein